MPQRKAQTKPERASTLAQLTARMRHTLRLFCSAVFVIPALLLLLLAEILIFGLGLNGRLNTYVERLEHTQNTALEVALARAAEMEARSLSKLIPTQGSASVGTQKPDDKPRSGNPSDIPDLRPRDIDDILNQETDILVEQFEQEQAEAEAAAAAAAQATSEQTPAGDKDKAELDRLIHAGVAALVEGDMRRCVLSFEQAMLINPKHPALLYYYGMAYDKLLNPNKARQYYSDLYAMRDAAGKYFEKAARRLTYGINHPSDMRGKLAFGPKYERASRSEDGQTVEVVLPVLLAEREDLLAEDIYIHIQFFDIESGKTIKLADQAPELLWENETPTWQDYEERLIARYTIPNQHGKPNTSNYYGFTAKLYYKGEPMDCISSPAVLILHEQRLQSPGQQYDNSILPDDGLDYSFEEAIPYADFQ